jgi:hypothetical protein
MEFVSSARPVNILHAMKGEIICFKYPYVVVLDVLSAGPITATVRRDQV